MNDRGKERTEAINADEKQIFLTDAKEETFEEDAIIELNQIAILSSSKFSLKKKHSIDAASKEVTRQAKSRLELFVDKIPLKGYVFTLASALLASTLSILLKFATTVSGTEAG
jgi:hypothetical protein